MLDTEIDSIPVRYEMDGGDSAAYTASLTFDLPYGSETAATNGLNHLVWALALRSVGAYPTPSYAEIDRIRGSYLTDALEVDVDTRGPAVEIYAAGARIDVLAFLTRLCEAFRNPPIELLADVAASLDERDRNDFEEGEPALFALRYGYAGSGLAYWPARAYPSFTPGQVLDQANRVFVSGNAAVSLDGPPPTDLRLPLTIGPGTVATPPAPARPAGPIWAAMWNGRPGVIFRRRTMLTDLVAMQVLMSRIKPLGSATHSAVPYTEAATDWLVVIDTKSGKSGKAVELMWRAIRDLGADGPGDKELRGVVQEYNRLLVRGGLTSDADDAEFLTQNNAVTPDEVRAFFREAEPTAMFTVPHGETVDVAGLSEAGSPNTPYVPDGEVFPARRLGFRRSDGPRLVLTADSVTQVDADGRATTVRRSDGTLVDASGDRRVIVGPDLATVVVDPDRFAGAVAAVRAVDGWF